MDENLSLNSQVGRLFKQNRELKSEDEKLRADPLHKLYQATKESEQHWHKKWQGCFADLKIAKQEIQTLSARDKQTSKEMSNMARGIQRRDQTIENQNHEISARDEKVANLEEKVEELLRAGRSLENIINLYMMVFGPAPEPVIVTIVEESEEEKEPEETDHSQNSPLSEEEEQEIRDELKKKEEELSKKKAEKANKEAEKAQMQAEIEDTDTEIKEAQAEIAKLNKRLGLNSQNSGVPSSQEGLKKKRVTNNRERTGNKRGGQEGHEGHHLSLLSSPDEIIVLETDSKFLNQSRYVKTGKKVRKQLVQLSIKPYVTQYEADVYYDQIGGYEVNGASFPYGLMNEVTYGSSVKAAGMFLHTIGNMSYAKVREFLMEATGGVLAPSCSFLQSLEKEFSTKTQEDRKQIMETMFKDPFMGIDCSPIRVSGHFEYVLTLTTEHGVLYFTAKRKGEELVSKTPLLRLKKSKKNPDPDNQAGKIAYQGVMIHDCEAEFFNYALFNQLCVIHEMRYLRGAADFEQDITWAALMRELLKSACAEAKAARDRNEKEAAPEKRQEILDKYDQLISLGEQEYSALSETLLKYRDGPGVVERLKTNKEMLIYFLNDASINYTNNDSGKSLRAIKMHSKQSGGYFSSQAVEHYLDSMGVLESIHRSGGSRYKKLLSTLGPDSQQASE